MARLRTAAWVVALSACGSLDNAPFEPAVVRGTLLQSQAGLAVAAIRDGGLAQLDLSSGVFELDQVQPGPTTLYLMANADAGVLLPVQVRGGAVNDLGVVELRPPARLELEVEAPSAQRLDLAVVTLDGVPAHISPTSELGEVTVGPVPAGCYQLVVQAPGFATISSAICLEAGVHRELSLRLPEPDGAEHTGCRATGCLVGYSCEESTGRCSR